jgi:carbamate kinase
VEAVIDKDHAGALLARSLKAEVYLMLTDAQAVWHDWGTERARPIRRASPDALAKIEFAAGSMGPKVEAACAYVGQTGGRAGIGALDDAVAIVEGRAGTLISAEFEGIEYWPSLFDQPQ